MASRAQRAADRAFQRAMERWLTHLGESERMSRDVHNRIARRVASQLRRASADQVNRVIRRAFDAFEDDRVAIIEDAVREASARGAGMTEQVARAVFGNARARGTLSPVIDPDKVRRRVAGERMNGALTADRTSVRARLRTRTRVVADRMAAEVEDSLQLGETTIETSRRILRATDITVRIPKYIQEVRDAVRSARPSNVRSVVRRQLDALEHGRIQEHNIASETERFLHRVRRSQGADIDSAVETWVRGRAQNQAMTIARTEGQSALAQTYVETTREQPWVVGYRFNLSPAHERPDVCNILAAQDNFGLGAGGYPSDAVPALGHPNCLCYVTAIIDEHFQERELAQRRGQPEPPRAWETAGGLDGRRWLQQQSAETRAQILGPGRAREFERRPTRVVNADGSLNPLYAIQGRPPPPPPTGERFVHRAEGRVERVGEPPPRRGRSQR